MPSEPADSESDCVAFLQWALPRMQLRWPGFRTVRKRACKRIVRRLRELGLADFAAYRAHLVGHADEWTVLDAACRIVVSHFYRDRAVFDRLRDEGLPRLAAAARAVGRSRVDVWSAGCACGEEPWTLRILWDRHVARRDPRVELHILATDADERVLERARLAEYPASSLRSAPAEWRTAVFTGSEGTFRLADTYRHGVEFRCQDIRAVMPDGPFDLILCRNLVFTYFDASLQRTIAGGLRARLRPGGEIVVGAHERLPPE